MVFPLLPNGHWTWKIKQIHKKLKSYIYLISPKTIRGKKFYNQLDQILETKKIKYFQLRLKKTSNKKIIQISKKIKKILKKYNVKFLINDKPLVAKMVGADGCHIGQNDESLINSRKILGNKKIIGVTCHNSKALALVAKNNGANYVAFGAFFKSSTKKTVFRANIELLRWAKKKINMPTVAIGGINNSNYKLILSSGANFIACSSYVWNNKKLDPVSAINKFR